MSSSWRSRGAGCLVAVAVAVSAHHASAFCRTTTCSDCGTDDQMCPLGDAISWRGQCISFSLHYSGSKQVDYATASQVIQRAFDAWQNAECPDGTGKPSIRLQQVFGAVACDLHEYNQGDANANIVMFRDDEWPYDGPANVLALTTVTYSRRTGEIYDVDMEINGTQPLSASDAVPPGRYDLLSIVTHEAGHFLGLGHSQHDTATMAATYTSGNDSFRELDPDDVAGICTVLPPNREALACDFRPRKGFSPECGIYPSGKAGRCSFAPLGLLHGGSFAWLAAPLAAAVVRLLRRPRRSSVTRGPTSRWGARKN